MNERIKELIAECTTVENGVMQVRRNETVYHFDKVKFAELLIHQCMDCSTWVGKMNTNSVEPVHTAHAINQRIKAYFGVEE